MAYGQGTTFMKKSPQRLIGPVAGIVLLSGWLSLPAIAAAQDGAGSTKAFVGARIMDGTGKPAMEKATLVIRNGRVEGVGPKVKVQTGAEQLDASGKTIIPGLINAHGHVTNTDQLGVYLRDGITTIFSLGGDQEFALRDQCRSAAPGTLPRLYVAGPVVASKTPEEARKTVDELIAHEPDIVKIRIDDALGTRPKMTPDVYKAVIEEAHKNGFRLAAHIVLLDAPVGVLPPAAHYTLPRLPDPH